MIRWLQSDNVGEFIKEGTHILEFGAEWCGGTKLLAPVLEAIEKDIDVIRINVDAHGDVAEKFKIQSIPTMIITKDGQIVKTVVGNRTKEQLLEILKESTK